MSTKSFWIWVAIILIADVIFTVNTYGQMPERVPIHWNAEGQVDGWGNRNTYLWMGPGLVLFGLLLAVLIPVLSPPKYKIDSFRETFNSIMLFVVMLMAYIHGFTAYSALHPKEELSRFMVAGIFVFFSLMGNLMGRLKPNFYAGIRTPWTLANDDVWRLTHRLGGKMFFYGGIVGAVLALAGFLIPAVVVILIVAFTPVIYSFVLSKKLETSSPSD